MTTQTTTITAPAPERVTPLKPSEAMRLGRLKVARAWQGEWRSPDGSAVCAAGAMAVGYGWDPASETEAEAANLLNARGVHDQLIQEIADYNDDERWTTWRIADWLEGLGL